MKRTAYVMTVLVVAASLPLSAAAQQDPTERLAAALPPDVFEQVIGHIEAARADGLPEQSVANLALQGVAKGRSADDVLAAVETLAHDLSTARGALQAAGHEPSAGELEAATMAMRMGVDADAISELAASQPSGRTMSVPLLVLGSLTARGLPSDEAIAAVRARLDEGVDDDEIASLSHGIGGLPEGAGLGLAGEMAGFQVPVSGVTVPVGPPSEIGSRPGSPGAPSGVPAGPGN